MITVRQMERLWSGKAYEKLFRELLAARPTSGFSLITQSAELRLVTRWG